MKKLLKPFFSLLLISLVAGCAGFKGLGTPVERKVVDNDLYSNKYPEAVIAVSKEITYEGMIPQNIWTRYSNDTSGSTIETSKYLFSAADQNKNMKQLLIVDFARSTSGQWRQGFKKDCCVETGQINLDKHSFKTALIGLNVEKKDDVIIEYLEAANYKIPMCVMGKFYEKVYDSRARKDLKLSILYVEPIGCDKNVMFLPEYRDDGKTGEFIKAFNKRADSSFMYTHL